MNSEGKTAYCQTASCLTEQKWADRNAYTPTWNVPKSKMRISDFSWWKPVCGTIRYEGFRFILKSRTFRVSIICVSPKRRKRNDERLCSQIEICNYIINNENKKITLEKFFSQIRFSIQCVRWNCIWSMRNNHIA